MASTTSTVAAATFGPHTKRPFGERSEDLACEQAALSLFKHLDPSGTGFVQKAQVLPLWPALARHVEGGSAEALLVQLHQRTAPIAQQDWVSLTDALRAVVGPRRFRSSLRRAEAIAADIAAEKGGSGSQGRYTDWAPSLPPVPGVAWKTLPRSAGGSALPAQAERLSSFPIGDSNRSRLGSASCPQLHAEPAPPSSAPVGLASPPPPPVGSSRAAARYAAGARRLGFDPMSFGSSVRTSPAGSSPTALDGPPQKLSAVSSSPSLGGYPSPGGSPKDSHGAFHRGSGPIGSRGSDGPIGGPVHEREAPPRRLEALPKARSESSSKEIPVLRSEEDPCRTASKDDASDTTPLVRITAPDSEASQALSLSTDEDLRRQVRGILWEHQRRGTFEGRRSELQEEIRRKLGVDAQRFRDLFRDELSRSRKGSKSSVISKSGTNKGSRSSSSVGHRDSVTLTVPEAKPGKSEAKARERTPTASSSNSESDEDSSDESSNCRFAFYAGHLVMVPAEDEAEKKASSPSSSRHHAPESEHPLQERRRRSSHVLLAQNDEQQTPAIAIWTPEDAQAAGTGVPTITVAPASLQQSPSYGSESQASAVFEPHDWSRQNSAENSAEAPAIFVSAPPDDGQRFSEANSGSDPTASEAHSIMTFSGVEAATAAATSPVSGAAAIKEQARKALLEASKKGTLAEAMEAATAEATSPVSGAAALREQARKALLEACKKGTLAEAMEAALNPPPGLAAAPEEKGPISAIQSKAHNSSLKASRTGNMLDVLKGPHQSAPEPKDEDSEVAVRSQARNSLLQASRDGRLLGILQEGTSLKRLRATAKDALKSALDDKSLQRYLQDQRASEEPDRGDVRKGTQLLLSKAVQDDTLDAQLQLLRPPSSSGTSEAEVLRRRALDILQRSAEEGSLAEKLKQAAPQRRTRGDTVEETRVQAVAMILKGAEDGSLAEAIESFSRDQTPHSTQKLALGQQAQDVHSIVASALVQGAEDGSLRDAMAQVKEASSEEEPPSEEDSVRQRMKAAFMGSAAKGDAAKGDTAKGDAAKVAEDPAASEELEDVRQRMKAAFVGKGQKDDGAEAEKENLRVLAKDSLLKAAQDGDLLAAMEALRPNDSEDSYAGVSFRVDNISYEALTADAALCASFQAAVKDSIASDAGHGVEPRQVDLSLSAGSVKVLADLHLRADQRPKVLSSLRSSSSLGANLESRIAGVSGIDKVCSAPVKVEDLRVLEEPDESDEAEESEDEDLGPLFAQVRGSLVGAAEDGTLSSLLAEDPKPTEDEELACDEARNLFLKAAKDGRLATALEDSKEKSGGDPVCAEAQGTLLKAAQDGSLEPAMLQLQALKALSRAAVENVLRSAVARAKQMAEEPQPESLRGDEEEKAEEEKAEEEKPSAEELERSKEMARIALQNALLVDAEEDEEEEQEELEDTKEKAAAALEKALLVDGEEEEEDLEDTKETAAAALEKALLVDGEEEEDEGAGHAAQDLEDTKEEAAAALEKALLFDAEEEEDEEAKNLEVLRSKAKAAMQGGSDSGALKAVLLRLPSTQEKQLANKAEAAAALEKALLEFDDDDGEEDQAAEDSDAELFAGVRASLVQGAQDGSLASALEESRQEREEEAAESGDDDGDDTELFSGVQALLVQGAQDGSLASAMKASRQEQAEEADQDLRLKAKADFLKAAQEGSLAAALVNARPGSEAASEEDKEQDEEDEGSDELRAVMKASVLKASKDGSLAKALDETRPAKAAAPAADDESQELRRAAMASFLKAANDGSFEDALKTVRPLDGEDEPEEEGAAEARSCVKESLLKANSQGNLKAVLEDMRAPQQEKKQEALKQVRIKAKDSLKATFLGGDAPKEASKEEPQQPAFQHTSPKGSVSVRESPLGRSMSANTGRSTASESCANLSMVTDDARSGVHSEVAAHVANSHCNSILDRACRMGSKQSECADVDELSQVAQDSPEPRRRFGSSNSETPSFHHSAHGDNSSVVSFGPGGAKVAAAEASSPPPLPLKADDDGCVSFVGSPRTAQKATLDFSKQSTVMPDDSLQALEEESFEQSKKSEASLHSSMQSNEEKPMPPAVSPAKRRPGRQKGSIVAAAEAQQKRLERLQRPQIAVKVSEPPAAPREVEPLPAPKDIVDPRSQEKKGDLEAASQEPPLLQVTEQQAKELRRIQSSPGGTLPPPGFDNMETEDLRNKLMHEMDLHRQTYERMKDLERKLRSANSRQTPHRSPPPRRFGVADPQPYATPPVSLATVNANAQANQGAGSHPKSPKRRGVYAPPLQPPPAPPAQSQGSRGQAAATAIADARAAAADARATVRSERMAPLTRAEQSRTRVEAIAELDAGGHNTWEVRRAEKVARYQDLKVFGESMWDSFFDWKHDANGTE